MFKWTSKESPKNEFDLTIIYVCAKSPILNCDPTAYNPRFFEIAGSTLYNNNTGNQIFHTLDQAYKYVNGKGNIAIYEVIVPVNAIKKMGNEQICLDTKYHIAKENIKAIHSLFIGKDKSVANPNFNSSKVRKFDSNLKDNLLGNRASSPPRSST